MEFYGLDSIKIEDYVKEYPVDWLDSFIGMVNKGLCDSKEKGNYQPILVVNRITGEALNYYINNVPRERFCIKVIESPSLSGAIYRPPQKTSLFGVEAIFSDQITSGQFFIV